MINGHGRCYVSCRIYNLSIKHVVIVAANKGQRDPLRPDEPGLTFCCFHNKATGSLSLSLSLLQLLGLVCSYAIIVMTDIENVSSLLGSTDYA